MVTPTSDAKLETVLSRGVAEILPDKNSLSTLMSQRRIRVYLGIDPTGSLLTLGHSVVLRKLQQFAELGHEVILLIGNGTVKIGDPTGRDASRPTLTDAEIEANFKTWQVQASKILDFDHIMVVRNGDWLDKLTYSDLVRLMAKTTVQQLMERDMFQDRVAKGLPIHTHELIYPLLQGYDSVAMDVDLEIGGTDQTFNMMMGRHLLQEYKQKPKWVLTTPIIPGTDGRKMSKSFNNFVALTEPPADMYGKLMSIDDDQIMTYFTVLTDVSTDEIAAMSQELASGSNPMQFKKLLAKTITTFYHSADLAAEAEQTFEKVVQNKEVPDELIEVELTAQAAELPLIEILRHCSPETSGKELRRLVEQGGVALLPQNKKPTDPLELVRLSELEVVKIGKRRFYKISIT